MPFTYIPIVNHSDTLAKSLHRSLHSEVIYHKVFPNRNKAPSKHFQQ
ncbi:protein of unknown function [Shewanella benthica]|uniref:Uncharacterized protein n=1 Tax=Shewanella benthica TaxID=43661 RepID=A0A330MA14_9GAMM|nr:protein of unknown function [Shewanella benthica]